MKAMRLVGVCRGKFCVTTVPNRKAPCPLDKVNKAFKVQRHNALWIVDFTYVDTWVSESITMPPRKTRYIVMT